MIERTITQTEFAAAIRAVRTAPHRVDMEVIDGKNWVTIDGGEPRLLLPDPPGADEATEWLFQRYDPARPAEFSGALALRQCPECCALVLEDFLPEHQAWHARSTARSDPTNE